MSGENQEVQTEMIVNDKGADTGYSNFARDRDTRGGDCRFRA